MAISITVKVKLVGCVRLEVGAVCTARSTTKKSFACFEKMIDYVSILEPNDERFYLLPSIYLTQPTRFHYRKIYTIAPIVHCKLRIHFFPKSSTSVNAGIDHHSLRYHIVFN
jgi:hypothetical protein